ncbi:short chain dehydrogenase [Mycobacteroides abscessus subsp. abscessus]|uniref:SDR family NAD(P)-dependent oxidoreductase n=1 Tax=Mycobacteroides abscessus TaxID=36809 RepID=UPI00092BCD63|nr:SDR family NAD(P)-dependent oxidoreductase [Mycobacteroides abscessus]MDO3104580.1 SDR family NAD(P)-dependent oxidoreductase [Mycobacteroides abscessus subsp. abscessus]SIJ39962.1 Putative short-chain dehydrogenase/reductase [Mycobacteroides abscessus subsp. abscessus]SIN46060.1 short chain dehydrogenase [Mycobacteroides abscessus subsp. abscessus]SLG38886.1 Putative short-chain dehydrogenase/reductase [Mycobacteroides abscessus subsp. abscessus]
MNLYRGKPDRRVRLRLADVATLDLSGRHLAVIGGTSGLGRAITHQALMQGAKVTVAGRTFRDHGCGELTFLPADLSSMREAVDLADRLPLQDIDVLLFTNGIFAAKQREQTAEGIERDMAVSYLSRFAIIERAVQKLRSGRGTYPSRTRIFVMGGPGAGSLGDPDDLNAESTPYRVARTHMNTVAANEALVVAGAQAFPGPAYFGLNPGLIKTGIRANYLGNGSTIHKIFEALVGIAGQSPERYAQRIVPLLFTPDLEGWNAIMFNDKAKPIKASQGMTIDYANHFLASSRDLLARTSR